MSGKAREKRGKLARSASEKVEPESQQRAGVVLKPPMKPHRGVFILLCVVLAVWVGVLLVMYFRTVYPRRHGGAGERNGLSLDSRMSPSQADFR